MCYNECCMSDKNTKIINYLINLCFFLYFLILLLERSISVILSFVHKINIFATPFSSYVYILIFVSIIGFFIYLLLRCRKGVIGLFKKQEEYPFIDLCTASGILLLSGMVHSEYTISIIQFISYGILIVGILLKVILNHKESKNKPLLWISFVYLVCFSMAIPVMYYSLIKLHLLFHIIEAIGSFLLVGAFTYLFILLFLKKDDLLIIIPLILMLIIDIPLIVLRWNEEINMFVLIFASLSLIVFLIGLFFKKNQIKD